MCNKVGGEPGECFDVNGDSNSEETRRWHAMSAPYRRELQARDLFEAAGLEYFLPMRYILVTLPGGKKKRELRPAVPSLIFVKGTRKELQTLKDQKGIVQYLCRPEGERNVPIIVPDVQMNAFRKAIENSLNNFIYFRPGELNLSLGKRVRIIGGALNGCEGTFMKVKGARSRRLVIMLEGLGAVAAEVSPDFIELI
ncbi:MAG: UpxY family transcription antiterminator [Muribaculaceae bacterium]|nr:UpxY family transcription antiterminator [Muribaculaceae bacterium]